MRMKLLKSQKGPGVDESSINLVCCKAVCLQVYLSETQLQEMILSILSLLEI